MLDQLPESGRARLHPTRIAAISLTLHATGLVLVLSRPIQSPLVPTPKLSPPMVYLTQPVSQAGSRAPGTGESADVAMPIAAPRLDPVTIGPVRVVVPIQAPPMGAAAALPRLGQSVAAPDSWEAARAGTVDHSLTPPRQEGACAPVYPPTLVASGAEGVGVFEFTVDSGGRWVVGSLQVIQVDHPGFVEAWREALRGCVYLPARRGGVPVAAQVRQTVRFRLDQNPE